jgi:tetratricopeptide (TPR) repeat protein
VPCTLCYQRWVRRWITVAALGSCWLGCSSGTATEIVEAPPIQVSQPPPTRALWGAGDREAERCFAAFVADGDDCQRARPAAEPAGGTPCAAACRQGDVGACHLLGERFAADGDAACSAKLFDLACAHAGHPSCVARAEQLAAGATPAELPTRVVSLLNGACRAGYSPACTRLGIHRLAHPDQTMRATGRKLLEDACTAGDALGCATRADAHADRDPSNADADRAIAHKFRERACDLGHHASCIDVAKQLWFGHGGDDDKARAAELLDRVCALPASDDGGEACGLLARLLDTAKNTTVRVEQLYGRACDKGYFDGCLWVIGTMFHDQRYPAAIELSSKLISKHPLHWVPREVRGLSLFHLGKVGESVADFEALCRVRQDKPHCELWLYAARERSARKGTGKAALQRNTVDTNLSLWPGPVVGYYLGKLDEKALIDKAKAAHGQEEKEQLCEAYYYIGQQLLIEGKPKRAAEMFNKSIATEISNFIEYGGSKAELARMKIATP